MTDPFLEAVGVKTEEQAMKDSLTSALRVRRGSKIYARDELKGERRAFRAEFARLIREESRRYINAVQPVPKIHHCEAIVRIADRLSSKFKHCLCDERLRHGIAQKAFSLYLKYLWRLNLVVVPPQLCPVDRVVLRAAGIDGSWTKCVGEKEYMEWIHLSVRAEPLCLAEWEAQVCLEWFLAQKQRRSKAPRCCAESALGAESANQVNCGLRPIDRPS